MRPILKIHRKIITAESRQVQRQLSQHYGLNFLRFDRGIGVFQVLLPSLGPICELRKDSGHGVVPRRVREVSGTSL